MRHPAGGGLWAGQAPRHDFVTITDHDTISGALEIGDRPDVFVSEELTAWFRGERQAVHVLCWGISPMDHEWLQGNAADVELCAEYLHGHSIACALAHPFYVVAAPLTGRHRRRLAEILPVWETRNGARTPELNRPAATYIETHGGAGVGGSDDHAGVDIGRTWTETPSASSPEEFLCLLRRGESVACGDQGSAAKWAHVAMALAARALGRGEPSGAGPSPLAVFAMTERVMRQARDRSGPSAADLGPTDAGALLCAWLDSLDLHMTEQELLGWMQEDGFSHKDLYRRARRKHERRLQAATHQVIAAAAEGTGYEQAAASLFSACVPAIPYAPAAAFPRV